MTILWLCIIFAFIIAIRMINVSSNNENRKIIEEKNKLQNQLDDLNKNYVCLSDEDFLLLFSNLLNNIDEKTDNELVFAYLRSIYRDLKPELKDELMKRNEFAKFYNQLEV